MSDHLPACEKNAQYPDPAEHDCICAALRACEQRVLTLFVARIMDRMTDSDLDNVVSDDGKDLIWAAINALREEQK